MKRRISRNLPAYPFAVWTDLAWKTGEMMLASAQVVGHRTGRMAAAGSTPNVTDRREFALMGQEKIEAVTESVQAVAMQMMRMNSQVGARIFAQMVAGTVAMMSLATSRNSAQALTRQARLMRVMTQSAATANQLSGSTARLAHSALKPLHSRATANARRLGKR